jgi:hypothetical protein
VDTAGEAYFQLSNQIHCVTSCTQGFAERKLMLISEVVQACKKIHNDEIRKERLAALKTKQVWLWVSQPKRASNQQNNAAWNSASPEVIMIIQNRCQGVPVCITYHMQYRLSLSFVHSVFNFYGAALYAYLS